MGVRKQQEIKLQAAMHGIPMEKEKIPPPSKSSTPDFQRQLAEKIAKGLPVKILTLPRTKV